MRIVFCPFIAILVSLLGVGSTRAQEFVDPLSKAGLRVLSLLGDGVKLEIFEGGRQLPGEFADRVTSGMGYFAPSAMKIIASDGTARSAPVRVEAQAGSVHLLVVTKVGETIEVCPVLYEGTSVGVSQPEQEEEREQGEEAMPFAQVRVLDLRSEPKGWVKVGGDLAETSEKKRLSTLLTCRPHTNHELLLGEDKETGFLSVGDPAAVLVVLEDSDSVEAPLKLSVWHFGL